MATTEFQLAREVCQSLTCCAGFLPATSRSKGIGSVCFGGSGGCVICLFVLGFKSFASGSGGAGVAFSLPLRDETGGFDAEGAGVDFVVVRGAATMAGVDEGVAFEVDATGAGVGAEGSGIGGTFGVAKRKMDSNGKCKFERKRRNDG